MTTNSLGRTLFAALMLASVWIVWSWHFEPLILGFGVVAVISTIVVARRLQGVDIEGMPLELGLRLLVYIPWLVGQVIKANLQTARLILHPKLPVRPHLIRVAASQRTSLGRVIYANSITLTPGTITLDLRDGVLLVHCLDDKMASQEGSSDAASMVGWLEKILPSGREPSGDEP